MRTIPDIDRANLAKYLTIAKLKLENAIAMAMWVVAGGRRKAAVSSSHWGPAAGMSCADADGADEIAGDEDAVGVLEAAASAAGTEIGPSGRWSC
mgnify:CR=1 FL=1